jgi:chromosome segregation ATPase
MSSVFGPSSEVLAQLSYLRALYQKKSALTFDISQLKIKLTHRQTSTDYKELRECSTTSKIISKKLEELQYSHKSAKNTEIPPISSETKESLQEILQVSSSNIETMEQMLHEAQDSQKYSNLLKEKFNFLQEEYERKRVRKAFNEKNLATSSEFREILADLEAEIAETTEKIAGFDQENERLMNKKRSISRTHRKSVEKIKIYHQLSENAMRLRSKLLFRKDLRHSISNAELELEFHSQRVQKEEDKLSELEAEIEQDQKYLGSYEQELNKLDEYIAKLEYKLDNFYREKEDLMQRPKSISVPSENKEPEDSVTLSLVGLLSGFNKMREEKDSLIAENNKLKEKLMGLFNSKV